MASADVGDAPVRVAVQPDGRYLWVGNDAADESMGGVTVLDARTLERVGFVATGRGHHEIAFSDDSLYALITNGADGSLSVVDSQPLERVADVAVGGRRSRSSSRA